MSTRLPIKKLAELFAAYCERPLEFLDPARCQLYGGVEEYIVRLKPLSDLANLEHLGSGSFADVYALDSKWAIKVIKLNNRFTQYDRFVDLAMKHRGNPHFPRILYRGEWGHYRIYIMERLLTDGFYPERENLIHAVWYGKNPLLNYSCPHVKQCAELLHEHDLLSDLRMQNVLARADGTPVVTDPAGG